MKILFLIFIGGVLISEGLWAKESDAVMLTSTVSLIGPDGIRTSCIDLAGMSNEEYKTGGGLLHNGLGHKRTTYTSTEKLFNVPLLKWTPEIVEYLKNAVVSCVADRNSLSSLLRRVEIGRAHV